MATYEEKVARIEYLKTLETKEALDEILGFLKESDEMVYLYAIDALSCFSEFKEAKDTLLKFVGSHNEEYRYNATEALGYFEGDDVRDAITPRLHDEDEMVRVVAAESLGYVGDQQSVPLLEKALSDNDYLVRAYAAESLGMLGNKEVIPILKEHLKSEHVSRARLSFYVGLYLLGEEDYLSSIKALLKSKSPITREAVVNALVYIADERTCPQIMRTLQTILARREKRSFVRKTIENGLKELEEECSQ